MTRCKSSVSLDLNLGSCCYKHHFIIHFKCKVLLRKKKRIVFRPGMSFLFLTRVINSIFLSQVDCWAQVVCLHLYPRSAPYALCSGRSEHLCFLGLRPNDLVVGSQYAPDPLLQCQDHISFSQASPKQQVLLGNSVLEGHNYLQDIKLLTGYQRRLTSDLLKYGLQKNAKYTS